MIVVSPTNTAAVRALVNVLWAALDGNSIQASHPWPFNPDSVDFSAQGIVQIQVAGANGGVTFRFLQGGAPILSGVLDLAKLEAQLSGAPNYIDSNNASQLGPATSIEFDSAPFTAKKSGVVFITAEFDGTQVDQAVVAAQLYRDYGLPGQVTLAGWHITPGGGVGTNYWSGHIHDTDVLSDMLPHTYTIIASGSGGSDLTVAANAATIIVFELGAPG